MRYFVRYFSFPSGTAATVTGGTLVLTGLGSNLTSTAFKAQLSIDDGDTWYNLAADRGGNDVTGIKTGYASSTGTINFTYPGTTTSASADGVLVRIGWDQDLASLAISKIELKA